ncbi:hypothetical protein ACNQUF_11920, partial [Corynebacterium diphtheriae]
QVVEAYGIVHDKDEREVWSDTEKALVVEPKPEHLHAVIKFASRAKSAPLDRSRSASASSPSTSRSLAAGGTPSTTCCRI